jgi:hypothetical protein
VRRAPLRDRSHFLERGIEGHTGWRVSSVDAEGIDYENGERRGYDLLVAFPPYVPAVRYDGLPSEFAFDPVSMCVMEEFDRATFAQVPLRLTGDPGRPVEVRPDANGTYKVGVSPVWRLGKKMLGPLPALPLQGGEAVPRRSALEGDGGPEGDVDDARTQVGRA